jgi:hypothetical protein
LGSEDTPEKVEAPVPLVKQMEREFASESLKQATNFSFFLISSLISSFLLPSFLSSSLILFLVVFTSLSSLPPALSPFFSSSPCLSIPLLSFSLSFLYIY